MLSHFQAIIQGLRESGTFSSAIASAHSHSKKSFLSSVEGLQNKTSAVFPKSIAGESTSTQRRADSKASLATNRKILEFSDIFEMAVPPMSPPGLDDLHIGM